MPTFAEHLRQVFGDQAPTYLSEVHPFFSRNQIEFAKQTYQKYLQAHPDTQAFVLMDIDETTGDSTGVWHWVWCSLVSSFYEKYFPDLDISAQLPLLEQMQAEGGTNWFRSRLCSSAEDRPFAELAIEGEEFDFWQSMFMMSAGVNGHVVPIEPEKVSMALDLAKQQGVAFGGHLTTRNATDQGWQGTEYQLFAQFGYDSESVPPVIMRGEEYTEAETAQFKLDVLYELAHAVGRPMILVDDNDGMREMVIQYNLAHRADPDYIPIVLILYPGLRTPHDALIPEYEKYVFVSNWHQMPLTFRRVLATLEAEQYTFTDGLTNTL